MKKAKGGFPASLWETYSVFANCYGGVIILGVSENADGSWKTTGLTDERRLLDFAYDDEILKMYKRVCRRYVYRYPDYIKFYIDSYREMWDSEEQ